MNAVKKLALVLSLGSLLPFAQAAESADEAYLAVCRKDPGTPIPVAVVTPRVGSEYAGAAVEVSFTVDVAGKPVDISVVSTSDAVLAERVIAAVQQWRFQPAERNGVPVATKVVLPVRIVDASLAGTSYAVN